MIAFVAFSLRRGWQGLLRNGLMTIAATATMVLMLLLLAGFWIIQAGLNAGLQYVEQKVEVVADLQPDAQLSNVNALADHIRTLPEVASVEYVSKDEALRRFRERLAEQGREDLTGYLDTNPLPASLDVKLRDPRVFGNVVEELRADTTVVSSVKEIQKLVDQVLTITNIMRTAGVIILALVGLTVLFIIVNTIRLAVVARAEEIEIMRLVGASDAFIRWPFVFEGAMVGLLGAVITLALLATASQPIGRFLFDFFSVLPLQFGSLARDLTLLVVGTGLGLGVLGSWVSVRSYLVR